MNITQIYKQRQSQICESSASHGGETEDAVVLVYDVVPTGNLFLSFEGKFPFATQEKIVQRHGVISQIKGLFSSSVFKRSCVVVSLGPCDTYQIP
jgi:hypothetical protein